MAQDKFKVVEDEEGIVIFDESDDYVPGEEQVIEDDEDLDYWYIRKYEKQQEIRETEEKRRQRWISVCVIAGIIVFIAGISYFNFKGVLF